MSVDIHYQRDVFMLPVKEAQSLLKKSGKRKLRAEVVRITFLRVSLYATSHFCDRSMETNKTCLRQRCLVKC